MQLLRIFPGSHGSERLFVFHHAGGNGNQFAQVLRPYRDKFEIYVLDLPGRNFRLNEPAVSSMTDLIGRLIGEVSSLEAKPSYLFGHSMGAMIAFELSHKILKQNIFPILKLGISALEPLDQRRGLLSDLGDQEFLSKIEEFSTVPEFVRSDAQLFKLFLKALRCDIKLMESYPDTVEYLPIPTIIFGGINDKKVSPKDLQGWQRLVQTTSLPRMFDGDHFYLFNNFGAIIEVLTQKI